VLAAMSGGVDSAVAAALLHERGFRVTGVTLKLWCYGRSPVGPKACCTLEAIDEARAVARRRGFPHYVVDAEEVFRARVLQPFLDAYAAGRTPYPCALCNQHLKFGDLVARMALVGADLLTTGHFARVRHEADGSWALLRGRDRAKDQSYALWAIPYSVLPRVRFPLGDLAKEEVRAHARRLELPVWDKVESQDLCFVPDGDYAAFATRSLGETRGTEPGEIVDREGRALGRHPGVLRYTVGQRRGLGVAASQPLYVLEVDAAGNRLVVGPREALGAAGLVTEPANWLLPAPPGGGARAEVQIRYHHRPAPATLWPEEDGSVEVRFDTPQPAVTPGQSAVFYRGERVLGGAAIRAPLRERPAAPAATGAA
jgi:tRNA-specific 2-thiouridylase